jgi:UTP--glucose-1-phosphate uridylyltransferase
MSLANDLEALPAELAERLNHHGFSRATLLDLSRTLVGDAATRRRERNRVPGLVTAPPAEALRELPLPSTEAANGLREAGLKALANGEVALVVMAGGMATRMGGVVKALVPVAAGKTFLELRLRENELLSKQVGRAVPLWLMTSDATEAPIHKALEVAAAPAHVATFVQHLSLRLTPEGVLFRGEGGAPSAYATGHGDLPDALRRSGLLSTFRAQGGKTVWITNLDNLGASVDPLLLGWFLAQNEKLAVEVCPKLAGDRGGIPVRVGTRVEVLEEFRLPEAFDPSSVNVFNTNTFLVDAQVLEQESFMWTYFEVEKKVDGRPAIQFERLLQEMTHTVDAAYLRISRSGTSSRFMPVKDYDELTARMPDLVAMLSARGVL